MGMKGQSSGYQTSTYKHAEQRQVFFVKTIQPLFAKQGVVTLLMKRVSRLLGS
jgi:hypothetical protein